MKIIFGENIFYKECLNRWSNSEKTCPLCGQLTIPESEPNYKIFIEIKPDIPKPKIKFHLTLTLNDEYQRSFELLKVNYYLASKKVNVLFINVNYKSNGEFILTFAGIEKEQKILNEGKTEQIKLEEEKKREEEQKLLEQRTYIPVTKELFDYNDFVKKRHEIMKKNTPFADKISERQFFINKNLKMDENEEDKAKKNEEKDKTGEKEDEKEENVEYNPELYEEDIGNKDFDKDYFCYFLRNIYISNDIEMWLSIKIINKIL